MVGLVCFSWFGLVFWNRMTNLASVQNYSLFTYLELVEKFVVGGDRGSAGARISRPIIVIRLESKLINKIKATGSGALFLVFIQYFSPLWYSMVWFSWFGLVFWNRMINLASVQNCSLFRYLELVEKFVVGGNGGSAGARISRPIIVIRLESKLIN